MDRLVSGKDDAFMSHVASGDKEVARRGKGRYESLRAQITLVS